MSHIVTVQTQVRDPAAIHSACQRLQLPEPVWGPAGLFTSTAIGWQVRLPDWRYPVVCDTNSAKIHFDNFDGHWGRRSELDRFLQAYAVEKTRLEARKQGYTTFEQPLADGSIKVTIQVGE